MSWYETPLFTATPERLLAFFIGITIGLLILSTIDLIKMRYYKARERRRWMNVLDTGYEHQNGFDTGEEDYE